MPSPEASTAKVSLARLSFSSRWMITLKGIWKRNSYSRKKFLSSLRKGLPLCRALLLRRHLLFLFSFRSQRFPPKSFFFIRPLIDWSMLISIDLYFIAVSSGNLNPRKLFHYRYNCFIGSRRLMKLIEYSVNAIQFFIRSWRAKTDLARLSLPSSVDTKYLYSFSNRMILALKTLVIQYSNNGKPSQIKWDNSSVCPFQGKLLIISIHLNTLSEILGSSLCI